MSAADLQAGRLEQACPDCGTREAAGSYCTTAVGTVVLDRIHDLIGYRRWYRSHVGWLVESHREDMAELRLLLGLRRRARRQAPRHQHRYIGVPGAMVGDRLADIDVCQCGSVIVEPDPIDRYKATRDWTEAERAWGQR